MDVLTPIAGVINTDRGFLVLAFGAIVYLYLQTQALHRKNLEILQQVLPILATLPSLIEKLTAATHTIELTTQFCRPKVP